MISHGAGDLILNELLQVFGLDYRSLAFFRIVLGLIIIGDVIDRSHDLVAHYTDSGMPTRVLFWLIRPPSKGIVTRAIAQIYPHGFWYKMAVSAALIY